MAYGPPTLSSNPTELRMNYFTREDEDDQFGDFAEALIEQNAHVNLKSLYFDARKPQIYDEKFDWDSPAGFPPPWVSFFMSFLMHRKKLNLESLGLDGFIRDDCDSPARLIDGTVDLDNLRTLQLRFNDTPSSDKPEPTFLKFITAKTPKLEPLLINYGKSCSVKGEKIIERVLRETLPNQLKELWLKIAVGKSIDLEPVKTAILKHQQNLVILRFIDMKNLGRKKFEDIPGFAELNKFAIEDWESENIRRGCSPRFFVNDDPVLYSSDKRDRMIKRRIKSVEKMMESDSMFMGAAANLPHMSEYYARGFYFDMKKHGVLCNGKTITFKPDGAYF